MFESEERREEEGVLEREGQLDPEERREDEGGVMVPLSGIKAMVAFAGGADDSVLDVDDDEEMVADDNEEEEDADDFGVSSPEEEDEGVERALSSTLALSLSLALLFSAVVAFLLDAF